MASTDIFQFDYKNLFIQKNGFDDEISDMQFVHVDLLNKFNIRNKKYFMNVIGDSNSPLPLQGIPIKVFRDIYISNDYIVLKLYEVEPIMGREWIGICDNATAKWFNFFNDDAWACTSDPYLYINKANIDLTVYEGMELYGNIVAKINNITGISDIQIQCKYERINQESQSTSNYGFINLNKLKQALSVSDFQFSEENTCININTNGISIDVYCMGYTGFIASTSDNVITISRYHQKGNNASGAWATNSEVFNSTFIYDVQLNNVKLIK